MTEPFHPTSEGEARLKHDQTLWLDLRQEDFDFANGQIYFFSFGGFLAGQIDSQTGEFIYDDEAAESIRRTKTVCLYAPNAQEGSQIFIQFVDRVPDGTGRQASLLFVLRDHQWEVETRVDSRIVDMRLGKAGLARTANPFQPI